MLLSWTISFSIFAMIAGLLGFSHAAATTSFIGKDVFCPVRCVGLGTGYVRSRSASSPDAWGRRRKPLNGRIEPYWHQAWRRKGVAKKRSSETLRAR